MQSSTFVALDLISSCNLFDVGPDLMGLADPTLITLLTLLLAICCSILLGLQNGANGVKFLLGRALGSGLALALHGCHAGLGLVMQCTRLAGLV